MGMLSIRHSIFWRLLSAFMLIILVSIALSSSIEFMMTKSELPHLLTSLRTRNIAQILSSAYTRDRSWINLRDEIDRINRVENTDADETFSVRIVVRDLSGKTLYNSFSDLVLLENRPLIEGDSVNIIDTETSEVAGTVSLYISRHYLEQETSKYLFALFRARFFQGLISFFVLIIAAVFFSRRITAPITSLTKATQSIAQTGKVSLLTVNSSDELGQMSESFNRMILALENQKKLRRRLISDVSHEINTPLTVIRLEARGLKDHLVPLESASQRIIGEIDKLDNLVQDLDWLAETDSGEFQINPEICSPGRLVTDEVERWKFKAEIAGVSLSLLPMAPDIPDMNLDAGRIGQAIGNLISNGLKYTESGGFLEVGCFCESGSVHISVKDNGAGIAPENIPFLFERFYRVESSRERSSGGRGLGLSIVKQIVELHKGEVSVDSSPGQGSCFTISLPL